MLWSASKVSSCPLKMDIKSPVLPTHLTISTFGSNAGLLKSEKFHQTKLKFPSVTGFGILAPSPTINKISVSPFVYPHKTVTNAKFLTGSITQIPLFQSLNFYFLNNTKIYKELKPYRNLYWKFGKLLLTLFAQPIGSLT